MSQPWKDVGDRSDFTIALGDVLNGNIPISPPTVVFKVRKPVEPITDPVTYTEITYEAGVSPEFSAVATGVYEIAIAYTVYGKWTLRLDLFDVDDTPLGAWERPVTVRKSAFATPLSQLP